MIETNKYGLYLVFLKILKDDECLWQHYFNFSFLFKLYSSL